MKKVFLKKWLLAFSASTMLVYGAIYACGGGDWDWDYVFESNFAPEVFVDQAYAPLFLSQGLFYGGYTIENNADRFNTEIVSDWSEYLKNKLTHEQVSFFLLDSSVTDVTGLQQWYVSKKTNVSSEKWQQKINLKDARVKDFIAFLYYAKQIETASVTKDYWSYDPVQYHILTDERLPVKLEALYKNTSNEFLKNRYWFQVIKAYFYSENKQNGIAFFERTKNTVSKNLLYYRALSYVAGIHYKAKNYAIANYLYSRVFDQCPELRYVAVFCFHPQEEKDWNQSLALAKNADDKSALWALQGYYGDEEMAIENIFKLNPKSEYLDFLLTRLINSQEQNINQPFDGTVGQNKKSISDKISKTALQLVNDIAKSGKTQKLPLWNMAAGYLQTLNGDFKSAAAYFDEAKKQLPENDHLAAHQLRILRFVNHLSSIDHITAQEEQNLLSDLQWFYENLPAKKMNDLRYRYTIDWSKKYLSALYKAKDNKVMSEIFVRDPKFYDDPNNVNAMKTFLSKTQKTPFEQTALKVYDVSLDDIYEYEAITATFENKIPEAIGLMKKTEAQQRILLGNPFNGNIKDCHDCDHATYQETKYSKLDCLMIIKDMQEKLLKSDDIYTNSILLGNVFYNITHFGNARVFYESNILGWGATPYDFRDLSKSKVTDCSIAKMYYRKALSAAKTNEQKAKCQYMIAKCERNEYYNKKYYIGESIWDIKIERDGVNFVAWDGFIALKEKYFKTKYYQEVIAECGYFDTYVNNSKK